MLLDWWNRRKMLRALRKGPVTDRLWRQLRKELPLLRPLEVNEAVKLRELTTLFMEEKRFNGVQGIELDDRMKAIIASQACLMILRLGLESYSGWTEIIVYPEIFRVKRTVADESGIMHEQDSNLTSESSIS